MLLLNNFFFINTHGYYIKKKIANANIYTHENNNIKMMSIGRCYTMMS